ncbi:MAG: hypothetical protein IKO84_10580 [Butyrivibrio sp.]|nr:hypothetical protein [Butyrivibrio sp.]
MTVISEKKISYVKRLFVKTAAFMMVAAFGILLSACGKADNTTRVEVSKDGAVKSVIFEGFSEPNYDVNELTEMVNTKVSEYNSDYLSTKITVDSLKFDEEKKTIKLIMDYNNASDYAGFNDVPFFYGTVSEAEEKGYTISADMVGTGDDKLPDDWKEQYADKHIIICEEKVKVKTPYKIDYATKGVNVTGKKEAVLSEETEGEVQLLLSK